MNFWRSDCISEWYFMLCIFILSVWLKWGDMKSINLILSNRSGINSSSTNGS